MPQPLNLPWEVLDRWLEGRWVKVDDECIRFKGRHPLTIAERVEADAVLEYWVQQYVSANPDQFGLKELRGPLETGPDFRAKIRGFKGEVDIEVEVRCENYLKHGHHRDCRWDNVRVLIVLEGKEPDAEIRKKLPKKI